jgi:alanine racemase
MARRAVADVNVAAIERNLSRLCGVLSPGTQMCAVVKADGYGHGALEAARAALRGGASRIAVATGHEALELEQIELPILVMGALTVEELAVLPADAEVVAWSPEFVAHLGDRPTRVHVKLDTGMGRLGTRELDEALAVAELVEAAPALELVGAMTHFATADEDPEFLAAQLARFEPFVERLRDRRPAIVAHAANSAATLTARESHFDMVRCGIAIYGCDPMNRDPAAWALEPALALRSYVAAVKPARVGDSAGYGRRFVAERDTNVATLPIGYGDGIPRALTNNCEVLVAGRRYPLVGTVSMDNVTIDLGPETDVSVGEVATIIGTDGDERQTAEDLARRVGTISYEIVCGISRRVPRVYRRDGARSVE